MRRAGIRRLERFVIARSFDLVQNLVLRLGPALRISRRFKEIERGFQSRFPAPHRLRCASIRAADGRVVPRCFQNLLNTITKQCASSLNSPQ